MAHSIQLEDNAYGTLNVGIAATDSSITLTSGHGVRFPAVAAGQVFNACLLNSNNVLEEIQITAHSTSSAEMTIVRGANGTTAKAWSAGDRIEMRVSSEVLLRLAQEALIETVLATTDSSAYLGTMSPTPIGYVTGGLYQLTLATSNGTSAPTVNLNSLGAKTVVLDGGGALSASDMPRKGLYQYDGTNLVLMNPPAATPAGTSTLTNKTLTNPAYTDQVLTDGTAIDWNANNGAIATLTCSGTQAIRVMNAPTNLKKATYILHIYQASTQSGRIITAWNGVFQWPAGAAPTISTATASHDIVAFVSDGTNLYGVHKADFS